MSMLSYISKLSSINENQLARYGAKAERFPLRRRSMVAKRFSTGTEEALCVKQFLAVTKHFRTDAINCVHSVCNVQRFVVHTTE